MAKKVYKQTYENGDSYVGPLENDLPCAEGEYTYVNGDKYRGSYLGDYPHGQGTMYYKSNGDKYVGGWKNGDQFGKHSYYWANGNVCKDGIVNPDGSSSGVVTRADGTTYFGRWNKDGKAI